MADVVLVLVILAFFGFCALYVRGCERIIHTGEPAEAVGDAASERAVR
jgi:hypothetical protein